MSTLTVATRARAHPHRLAPTTTRPGTYSTLGVGLAVAVALSLELRLASLWHFGFDETWHVAVATVEPFRQFVRELQGLAHPPLFLTLLRTLLVPASRLSQDTGELLPRAISMGASLATIVLAYRCALEMSLTRPLAVLTAWVFALSSAHLSIAICVRGYSLSTALTMALLVCFVRVVRDPPSAPDRDRMGFVLAGWLATWTETCALLVFGAAIVVLGLESLRCAGFLRALIRGAGPAPRIRAVVVFVLGALGFAAWAAWSDGTGLVGHVSDFLPSQGESLAGFAGRGTTSLLDLFAPVELSSSRVGPWSIVLLVGVLGGLSYLYVPSRSPVSRQRAAVVAILVQVWVVLFLLGWFEIYPYGGKMRHQFVLFPLLVFISMFCVDEIARRLRAPSARALLHVVVAACVVTTAARGFRSVPMEEFSPVPTLFVTEIETVLDQRQPDDALYTAQINSIALFSHLRDYRWRVAEPMAGKLDVFSLEKPGARSIRVLRESGVWFFPSPIDMGTAQRLAVSLRRSGVGAVWIVALHFESRPVVPQPAEDERTRSLLASVGLHLDRRILFATGEALRVELRRDPASP